MSSHWFRCVLYISFYVVKLFLELVTWSSSCFTNVQLFAISYAIYDIGSSACEVINDLNGSLGF